MKKQISTLLTLVALFTTLLATAQLSGEERKKAITEFKNSQKNLVSTLKGLSPTQLNYKPADTVWSIAECLEHIAISERNLYGIVEMSLSQAKDETAESVFSDEKLIAIITSRQQKVKTRKEFEPTNQFGSTDGSLEAFKAQRAANMEFVKTTDKDLRNYFFDFPFGPTDTYQVLLFIAAHSQRHIDQIKALKGSAGFPEV
ncbi:MAG: DinB family protein [Marinoscillum sp.]